MKNGLVIALGLVLLSVISIQFLYFQTQLKEHKMHQDKLRQQNTQLKNECGSIDEDEDNNDEKQRSPTSKKEESKDDKQTQDNDNDNDDDNNNDDDDDDEEGKTLVVDHPDEKDNHDDADDVPKSGETHNLRNKAVDSKEYKESLDRVKHFSSVYSEFKWNGKNPIVPRSGPGSTLDYTQNIRSELLALILETGAKSMLDMGCGDLTWMPSVLRNSHLQQIGFKYTGVDAAGLIIKEHKERFANESTWSFKQLDFASEFDFPDVDIVFCRDAIQHLSIALVEKVLHKISMSKTIKYAVLSTFDKERDNPIPQIQEGDVFVSSWNYNLKKKPFNWPDPIRLMPDGGAKSMGVWKLPIKGAVG